MIDGLEVYDYVEREGVGDGVSGVYMRGERHDELGVTALVGLRRAEKFPFNLETRYDSKEVGLAVLWKIVRNRAKEHFMGFLYNSNLIYLRKRTGANLV